MLRITGSLFCFALVNDNPSNNSIRSISLFVKRSFNVLIRCCIALVAVVFVQPSAPAFICNSICRKRVSSLRRHFRQRYPGQSRPAVNGRMSINYDKKRHSFTVTVYSILRVS